MKVNRKLIIVLALLAVIGRARVAVLPGWVVPFPVLLLAPVVIVCATVVAWAVLRSPRAWTVTRPAESPEEVA